MIAIDQVFRTFRIKLRSFYAGGTYFEAFRNEAHPLEAVESVSGSLRTFGDDLRTYYVAAGDSLRILAGSFHVQEDYVSTLRIDLLEGRNLTEQIFEDGSGFYGVVNESLYRQLGSPELPTTVGLESKNGRTFADMIVSGVARDFHTKSLHSPIEPAFLMPRTALGGALSHFYIRINPDNRAHTIDNLRQIWIEITLGDGVRNAGSNTDNGLPFEYEMLDDFLGRHYLQEQSWLTIIRWSTVIMIVVAGFGMFGLSSLLLSRLTHEIGIRKILGASQSGIFWLLSKEFFYTVAIAAVFASPLTYWVADRWYANFSFYLPLPATSFLYAVLLSLVIMLVTIFHQTIKTVVSDPVRIIRYT